MIARLHSAVPLHTAASGLGLLIILSVILHFFFFAFEIPGNGVAHFTRTRFMHGPA